MIHTWFRCLVPVLLAAPTLARAGDPTPPSSSGPPSNAVLAELRPRVIALLGMEGAADRWKALGPEALTVLRQLASDPTETGARRAKAAEGMAYVDNPAASEVLRSYATDVNALPVLRQAAVRGLASRDGTGAVSPLTPLLADGDAGLRLAVASALGSIGGPDARAALQGRLGAEVDGKVRDEIQKDLTRTAN